MSNLNKKKFNLKLKEIKNSQRCLMQTKKDYIKRLKWGYIVSFIFLFFALEYLN